MSIAGSGSSHGGHSARSMVPREARRFQGDRAGFFTRLFAVGIDFAVVAVILTTLYVAWAVVDFAINPTSFTLPDLTFGLMLAAAAVVSWGSFALAWATTGRTLGARVMGIRVVNYRGQVMRPAGAALRAAFCLGFMPGLFWVIVSNENRSLQDTVMRTSVIYDWTKRAPEQEARVLDAEPPGDL